MSCGFQQIILPVFGDTDLTHRRARVIDHPEIPWGHGGCLEGVEEDNDEYDCGGYDYNSEAFTRTPLIGDPLE